MAKNFLIKKKSSMRVVELLSQNNQAKNELKTPRERYKSPAKRQLVIDELRLV